jgi:hypothetical protein
VREKKAAQMFEQDLSARLTGERPDQLHPQVRDRLDVAVRLAALDLAAESRNRDWTRARMIEASARPSVLSAPVQGRWWRQHPAIAASMSVAVLLLVLAALSPGTVVALTAPLTKLFRAGVHTAVVVPSERTPTEMQAEVAAAGQANAGKATWSWDGGRYGAFGGLVPDGHATTLKRVSSLRELKQETQLPLRVPTSVYRGAPVAFDHALVSPDGQVLMFFGSGPNELLISVSPTGWYFMRYNPTTTADGRTVFRAPQRQIEELLLDGQNVVWDPRTTKGDCASLLLWETDGVGFSLQGPSLTREEAEDIFLSLRPADEE